MKKKDKSSNGINEKILESKRIIALEKKKIKKEKEIIRNKKIAKFKKTRLGKIIFFLSDDRNSYSFSGMFTISLISLVVGAFACFCLFSILFGGRNYFKYAKQFKKFYDAYDVMATNYYGDVTEDELIDSAISGMVASVGDVYTSYSDINTTDKFNQMVDGKYEGIGCTITMIDDVIKIVEVYDNTPASKAGLKKDDIIKSIDNQDAVELGIDALADYIKNGEKNKITMVIDRNGEEMTLNLERGKVEIPAVTSKVYEENGKKIGYIDIDIFSSVAAKQFKSELDKIEKDGINGLIIDVRDNNGGYLTSVTDIVSYLLPKGNIIYQMETNNNKKATKDKTKDFREYPIAVLTNWASASASEILAAAIKESYNGYVVGTKTYGKGTVQQVKKLIDGSMVKYTTQKWLTPNGNWINEVGIEPTDEVKLDEEYYENPSEELDTQLKKAIELVSK